MLWKIFVRIENFLEEKRLREKDGSGRTANQSRATYKKDWVSPLIPGVPGRATFLF